MREHLAALATWGGPARLVKRPADLDGLDGLVLPGGESTTLSMLLESTGLFEALAERLAAAPGGVGSCRCSGTCAGLVLVAREVLDGRPDQRTFGVLDAVVRRNGYGRQVQSFESASASAPVRGRRCRPSSSGRRWWSRWGRRWRCSPRWTASRSWCAQGPVLASSFHPELTPDRRVHRLFAEMVRGAGCRRRGRRGRCWCWCRRPRCRCPARVATGTALASMRRYVLTVTCPDRVGIVAAVTGLIAGHGGSVLEAAQHGDLQTRRASSCASRSSPTASRRGSARPSCRLPSRRSPPSSTWSGT